MLVHFILFQDMVRALEQLVALRTELQESNSTCEQQVSVLEFNDPRLLTASQVVLKFRD